MNCLASLNIPALQRAILALVERHETLRCRYLTDATGALRLEFPSVDVVALPLLDLSSYPAEQARALHTIAERNEANRPFDLATGVLFRPVLYRLAAESHILQLTMHHVATDGWSVPVMFRDLAALYNAALSGSAPALPELSITFSGFARYQRQQFAGAEGQRLLSYWKKQLAGSSFILPLPTDRPRPPKQTFSGAVHRYALDRALVADLHQFCLREQVTPYMVALAVYYMVLRSYTGQNDIIIGSPVAARTHIETEDLVGYLTNTVLVRCNMQDSPSFRELLHRVRHTALEAYDHQDFPLELLINELAPARDPSRAALFQTMLVYQNAPPQALNFQGLEAKFEGIRADASKLDLILELVPGEDSLGALIEFNTDLFDATTIDRLWSHILTYLQRAIADPGHSATGISPLSSAEQHQMLVEWNDTAADYPLETSLAALIEAQAASTPNAIAVVDDTFRLTYRELNERANQLAHELRRQGVGPTDLVGLMVSRSAEMVLAMLAIVKAGAAYLPLDPLLPQDRLRYMLQDSGLRYLIAERALVMKLPDFTGITILLDHDGWRTQRRSNPAIPVSPRQVAYVIYTSGSTGKPKGVQVPRGALTNLLWSVRSLLELTAADRLLAITTISFDISGMDIWLPLLVGAQIVVASREAALDGALLHELVAKHEITIMQATPVTWLMLMEAGWHGTPGMQAICTGEAMPPELALQLTPLVRRLWNLYGPTETTIWSTGCLITDPRQPILIGRPIANTQCYILDAQRQPVPIGATGELYLGGDGLALGYLNRPDLTADRFVPNPFGPAGSLLYRTGDLARYCPDGNIECLGRIDHQVKVRGYRIEPGEIEAALEQQPEIERAVVVARAGVTGDKRLLAFLVTRDKRELDPADLRKRLRRTLPNYMVPAAFHFLEALPLSSAGKIDRNALQAPADIRAAVRETSSANLTRVQQILVRLWAENLDLPHVDLGDDFFELGGNSLQAVRLLTRIRAAFPEARPSFADILNAPSVGQFARALDAAESHRSCVVPVRTGQRPALFCAHGAGGNALSLRELFFALPSDQPVYCLEARGQDGTEEPFRSVAESADFYIREMRKIQPHGPYHVGGECYGGLIAYEMACRLRALGESVGVVALIDTENGIYGELLPRPTWLVLNAKFFLRRMRHHLKALSRMSPREARSYFGGRIAALTRRLGPRRPAPRPVREVTGDAAIRETVRAASLAASAAYRPGPYDGHLLVFSASLRNDDPYRDEALGWRPLAAGGVTAQAFRADHNSLVHLPIVGVVAQKLDAAIRALPPR